MKLLTPVILVFVLIVLPRWAHAEASLDEIHLHNGGLIKGTISEHKPGVSYTIETAGGTIFVFEEEKVAKVVYGRDLSTGKEDFEEAEIVVKPTFPGISPKKKNPWGAVLLSFVVPTVGHAYAGDWGRGLNYGLIELVSFVAIGVGANMTENECTFFGGCREETTSTGDAIAGIGLLVFIVVRVGEFMDAYDTAQDYNKELSGIAMTSIGTFGSGDLAGLRVAYRF